MHFIITVDDKPEEGYLAYAGACDFDNQYRPKFALVNYNLAFMRDLMEVGHHTHFEEAYETTLHEMVHAFGFISEYIPMWIDPITEVPYGVNHAMTETITVRNK